MGLEWVKDHLWVFEGSLGLEVYGLDGPSMIRLNENKFQWEL